jgi:hypothetical protein
VRANGASISANGTPRHRASASRSSAARDRGAGAYDRLLEAFEVELAVGDANQVAGRPLDDQVAAERLAQLGGVNLERRRGRLRLLDAPQLLDQAVTRDGIVGMQEQKRQEGALLRTSDPHDPAVLLDLQRPEGCGAPCASSPSFSGALGPAKRSFSPSGSYLQKTTDGGQEAKEANMKRLTSYLVVIAAVVAAVAAVPAAHAGNPSAAALRAIELRSQELGKLCQSGTLSRDLYIGHCGPITQASNPNAAAVRAIELRSQELGKLCLSGTLSRELYIGHCGPITQASNPNAAAVRAIELRSQELGKLCLSGTLSRELYIGHCGTKRAEDHSTAADLRAVEIRGQAIDQVATVRATPTSAGFDWADFGIGAGSMLGLVLLAGGVATRVHGRKGSVRPRPAP